ncbi:FHA domain-containing protein [Cystobacter ferrugineus]|nr:FHA domain-containing protein [Cystobacter ferrugineus]
MRDEITIGRQEGNTIRLTERNVSRRHARLRRQNGHVVVEDLGSYNGVRINGERIQGPAQVEDGDLIQIGDYDLAVQREVPQPVAPTIRVPASALQAAIAQAESAAAAAAAAQGAASEEDEEDSDDSAEDTPANAAEENTTVLPGKQRRQSTAVIRLDQVEMNRPRRLESVEPEIAPRLIVVSPEFKGQEFACIRTEMRVGRTEDNDIAIDHRSLSRLHAKIVREDTGEWRIIDMQSANGMSVNGEIYAQASLSHGDIVELGHVKLRFVGPGESASGLVNDAAAKGSKKGLVLGLTGLVLLGAAGGAAWFLFGQTPSSPPAPVAAAEPPAQEAPPTQANTAPPPVEPATDTTPPPTQAAATAEQKLQPAQDAIKARDFDKAVALLEAMGGAGQRPAQAEELLKQARAEQEAKKNLEQARKAFEAGNLQDAQKGLTAAGSTVAFATERTRLKEKVDTALAKEATRPAAGTAPRQDPVADAKKLLEDGKGLLRQQQYQEAEAVFRKCIAADPTNAPCQMMMGTTQARMGHFDKGAQFYREFLRLAPNDANAPKVKKLVDDYEKSLKTGGGK